MSTVWILNNTSEELIDKWAGETFKFPPNTPVEVPVEVAMHTFGYLRDDKEYNLIRLGWTKTNLDMPQALERLSKFDISETRQQVYRKSQSPTIDRTPLPSAIRGGGKGTQAA
jgi:hypothetical protein